MTFQIEGNIIHLFAFAFPPGPLVTEKFASLLFSSTQWSHQRVLTSKDSTPYSNPVV